MISLEWAFCAWIIGQKTEQRPAGTALGAAYEDWGKIRCTVEQSTAETEQQGRGSCFSIEEIISTNNIEESQANLAGKNSIGKASPKPVETRQTMNSLLTLVTELLGWLEAELIFLCEFFIVLLQNSFLALQSV